MQKRSLQSTDNKANSSGTLVFVVGASGVGKDTLLDGAKHALKRHPKVRFVQRDITRPIDSGGEDHRAVSESEFLELRAAGAYALDWAANGLYYGLPASLIGDLAAGYVVIANGSRAAIAQARLNFPSLLIVNIVADAEIVAERLQKRGRESGLELRRRIERGAAIVVTGNDVVSIVNNGDASTAVEHLVTAIVARACKA